MHTHTQCLKSDQARIQIDVLSKHYVEQHTHTQTHTRVGRSSVVPYHDESEKRLLQNTGSFERKKKLKSCSKK